MRYLALGDGCLMLGLLRLPWQGLLYLDEWTSSGCFGTLKGANNGLRSLSGKTAERLDVRLTPAVTKVAFFDDIYRGLAHI
jgi:hypothetical protein